MAINLFQGWQCNYFLIGIVIMKNNRKDTRTDIDYKGFYIRFSNDSTPDQIIACVILDVSKHGVKISSTMPASDDKIVLFFSDLNKRNQIIMGRVMHCSYVHNISSHRANEFTIGIQFLDPAENITEFITSLVRCSSKIKVEKSFCLEQSQLTSDTSESGEEIKQVQVVDNSQTHAFEDKLEITVDDLEISLKEPSESDIKLLEKSTKTENDETFDLKKNKMSASVKLIKESESFKTSRRSSVFKLVCGLILLIAVGLSILIILPSSYTSNVPFMDRIKTEIF